MRRTRKRSGLLKMNLIKTFLGSFDPKVTPNKMNQSYGEFLGAVMPMKDQLGLNIKEKTANSTNALKDASDGSG